VGSSEFHTQSTFGQNNNKHQLCQKLIKLKFTNLMSLSKIQQEIHTHTHTAGCPQHSQHTQPKITNTTTGNTPNWLTKEKSTEKPISTAGSRRKLLFNSWTTTRRKISSPLLDGNRHFCSPKIGASPPSTYLSQISFSSILLLPSSSNPWGSGGDAGLEREGRR
jgi:hypothetical protein